MSQDPEHPGFIDQFSRVSADYARFRPRYPRELFVWIATLVDCHQLAWDCATGNGQAAIGLADHFAHVEATDASTEQLRHAMPHPHITYRHAQADASGLETASANVVSAAQALHWLPHERFYAEVKRVLAPKGPLRGQATAAVPAGYRRVASRTFAGLNRIEVLVFAP